MSGKHLSRRVFTCLAALMLYLAPSQSTFAVAVGLQNATALFHQTNFGNKDQTIDGNFSAGNGIGFDGNQPNINVIAWETQTDVAGGGLFTFQIHSLLGGSHQLKRFRLAATDADRSLFADGNPVNGGNAVQGDVVPSPGAFTLLAPVSATSSGGATMTVTPDGYITVTGTNPNTDVYTITARNPLASVTGFRLEVQPTGADNRIGRAANGNATITEFTADFVSGGSLASGLKQAVLQNATSTFSQAGFSASEAIDGVVLDVVNNGWGVFGGQNANQTAVFQTASPLTAGDLLLNLDFNSQYAEHKMQRFRLSYTTDAAPTIASGANWIELSPSFLDTSRTDSSINLLAGNIIEITGSGNISDFYSVLVKDLNVQGITGFRLEALLGANGLLGFNSVNNGNIVLTEFSVFATTIPEPATASLGLLALAGLMMRRRRMA